MNTANLKTYAPQARRDFLAAVKGRAMRFGISEGKAEPVTVHGDLLLIGGNPYPKAIEAARNQLLDKIRKQGYDRVMEEAAYTWFNRFMAIRYMEVHGYFDHGYRVLSNPSGATNPEILQNAQNVSLSTLDRQHVLRLLEAGTQQEELYRTLLLAQSKALGHAMPLLFDPIDRAIELLLPDGLLGPQSVVRKLVQTIPEDDRQSTEILGWLYQFYVSEEKARVDGLVKKGQAVQPEDIPAKTQLFTPNWIVQFMTQNSLGRLWMDVYPDSALKDKMPYYTAPAEQEPEVAAKLREITPSSLDPNALTAIDPAAGSGHILLVLYDLFFEFYRERGYPPADIARLIVSQNLYGLELDRRAAQIAGFAVLMRARRDDPTLLTKPPTVNVLSLVHSREMDAKAISDTLLAPIRGSSPLAPEEGLFPELAIQPRLAESVNSEATLFDVEALIELFEEADIYGSLIRVPDSLATKLPALRELVKTNLVIADLDRQATARELSHLVRQAEFLAAQYTVCVANPPYLGGTSLPRELKDFLKRQYPTSGPELYSCFADRGFSFVVDSGICAFLTIPNWMFIATFEAFRVNLLTHGTITHMAHIGRGAFGSDFGTTCFIFRASTVSNLRGDYRRLFSKAGSVSTSDELRSRFLVSSPVLASAEHFREIPGSPIAYWLNDATRATFQLGEQLHVRFRARTGMTTGDDERFLRRWHEVSASKLNTLATSSEAAKHSQCKWFPYNKGGIGERWYGHCGLVVNWENDGAEIKHWVVNNPNDPKTTSVSRRIFNAEFYFSQGATWTLLNTGSFNVRLLEPGSILNVNGPTITVTDKDDLHYLLSFLNSKVAHYLVQAISPTVANNPGDIGKLPFIKRDEGRIANLGAEIVRISKESWDSFEQSWNFVRAPLLNWRSEHLTVRACYKSWAEYTLSVIGAVKESEEAINAHFIEVFSVEEDLTPEIDVANITLTVNPQYRYGGMLSMAQREEKRQADAVKELLSYAVGCVAGRYSLDEPGLIYAHQGGIGFDPSRYQTFPADQDGILPVTDDDFFGEEDTANRLARWVKTVWPNSPLDENLDFISYALGRKTNETALEAIRRYLATDFYKDHLQTYKKRPIYWLFSSGKHRAFQALVYLHRYNEFTLSTLRRNYVQPLFGKLQARIELEEANAQSASAPERSRATARLKKLKDQLDELHKFDEQLNHYAQQRIPLDLDDGVRVNYGKFGTLLAQGKDVTGGKDE